MSTSDLSTFDPDSAPVHEGIYGLPPSLDDAALIVLPVPWEATTSYRTGTSLGPDAIYRASFQVEVYDLQLGRPYEHGIAMADPPAGLTERQRQAERARKLGRTAELDDHCRAMNELVRRETEQWRSRGRLVGLVGGEHGSSLGAIRQLADEFPSMGILQIDAHADLRESYQGLRYSHASFISNVLAEIPQVSLIAQAGIRDCCPAEIERIRSNSRLRTFFDQDTDDSPLESIVDVLPDHVWVTIDIDGLDPALCPNTGTPVPGGFNWREITRLLRLLAESGRRIVGFDLCEVAPGEGKPGDGWDEIVGARLLYKLCGWTIQTCAGRNRAAVRD